MEMFDSSQVKQLEELYQLGYRPIYQDGKIIRLEK